MYGRLKEYHDEIGDCNVPHYWNDGRKPKLGSWVSTQRRNYTKGKLTRERIEMLECIGFVWKKRKLSERYFVDTNTTDQVPKMNPLETGTAVAELCGPGN